MNIILIIGCLLGVGIGYLIGRLFDMNIRLKHLEKVNNELEYHCRMLENELHYMVNKND